MDSRHPPLPTATTFAHDLVRDRLEAGDTAIDATVGNGHDTLFLASLVGGRGRVVGFDIQEEAIQTTSEKTAGMPQVTLHRAGHEQLAEFVTGTARAVMFNLGYLPRGDKRITTLPETTLIALDAATSILGRGGIITIALYTGHPGGAEEAAAVTARCSELPQETFSVVRYEFLNQENSPPHLIAVARR